MHTHVPTGLPEFDDAFGGLEIGVLTLVVGHTGDGKSVLMKHLVKAAAVAGFGALAYFVEDPKARTADRFLADETGVASQDLGRLKLEAGEMADVRRAVADADWTRRAAVHFGPVTAEEVLADVARVKSVGGAPLGLVAVDYAQALADEGNLEKTCADTAKALNIMAGDRGIATVFGSQVKGEVLGRGREQYRKDRDVCGFCPGLGDAMWSRRLEQYAKAVLVGFRPGKWRLEMGEDARDDTFELHVKKASFGGSGWRSFGWDGEHARIYSRKAA